MKKLITVFLASVMLTFSLSAQSATLLSNLANTTGGDYGGTPDSADHFQTGTEALAVTSINVLWESADAEPAVNRVLIYTDVGGFPSSTTVGTPFTNPAVTATGVMQYNGTAELAPDTVYWMVVDQNDDSEVAFTFDHSFFSDPITGGAEMLERSAYGDNELVDWNDDPADLQYEVVGEAGFLEITPVPSLTGWGLAVLMLLIMAVVYRRRHLA